VTPEAFDIIYRIVMGLSAGAMAGLIVQGIRNRRHVDEKKDETWTMARASEEKDKKVEFCGSCGARKIRHQGQHGFKPDSGEPYILSFMACPNWDETAWRAKMALTPPSIFNYEPARDCEKMVFIPIAPTITHTNHADGDVSVDCKRCIIDMETAGIINHEDAETRLKEIA
jgi:hypothetical protein